MLIGRVKAMREKLSALFDDLSIKARLFSDHRWSRVAQFMNTRVISNLAVTLPIVGTLLLSMGTFKNSAAAVRKVFERLGVDPSQAISLLDLTTRLKLIYYGGFALFVAWVIYILLCPRIIQRHPVIEDYLREQAQIPDEIAFNRSRTFASTLYRPTPPTGARSEWTAAASVGLQRTMTAHDLRVALDIPRQESSRTIIFRACHTSAETQNSKAFFVCALLAIIGFTSITIPTLEVFWLVTSRLLQE